MDTNTRSTSAMDLVAPYAGRKGAIFTAMGKPEALRLLHSAFAGNTTAAADYLGYVLSRITLPGSIYLGLIAILPNLFMQVGQAGGVQNLPFGGTALLIMVVVALDTVKQVNSQLMQRKYEGFLN